MASSLKLISEPFSRSLPGSHLIFRDYDPFNLNCLLIAGHRGADIHVCSARRPEPARARLPLASGLTLQRAREGASLPVLIVIYHNFIRAYRYSTATIACATASSVISAYSARSPCFFLIRVWFGFHWKRK
jgi:hypothetical protein